MAEVMQFIDGFDDYGVGADIIQGGWSGSTPTSSATGNVAGRAMQIGGGNTTERSFTANDYVHYLFSWRPTSATQALTNLLRFFEGATEHLRLAYNGNGTFTFSRAGTTVGATPTSANMGIVSNTYYHIEFCARVHDTLGLYEIYLNGVLMCSGGAQNLDTRNGGTAGTANKISYTLAGGASVYLIDDAILYTGSGAGAGGTQAQIGMARVITGLPTADGTTVAWTASAGADYTTVDDNPNNGDTDYISSSTATQVDTFTYPALGVTGTVLGVAPTSLARKDDAGVRSIREVVRSGGTDYAGAADLTLTTAYVNYQQIWETNPATGVAWTVAGVDSAEAGVKLTA